jgi:aspartyl-tRNA(Asn)/glutamyl-tRNA(Gln) amidotransferase subunit C
MKKVTKEVLLDASSRLMFAMTDDQYTVLLNEFSILIKQMELIGKIPSVDQVQPMTFPFIHGDGSLRKDIPSTPLTQEEALSNAQAKRDGQIKLPKVVG